MSGNTQRQAWYAGAHRPGKLDIPFGWAVTLVIAAGLLWGGSQAIVLTRSVKYLVAYVIAGLLASGFLMLRRKHDFLLTCVGLSVPFEAGIILIDRGVILSITGTLVVIVLLAAVGFATYARGNSWSHSCEVCIGALPSSA